MATPLQPNQMKRRQALRSRIFWFLAGATLNYLLIATPFHWLERNTTLPHLVISACSLAVSSCVFFAWNYFVNFRTDSRKRDALARYLTAVSSMLGLSTLLLTLFKSFDAHRALNVGRFAVDLDIVATQFFLSWLKFLIYHKWAFPVAQDDEPQADPRNSWGETSTGNVPPELADEAPRT